MRGFYVYILTNHARTLYVGVTNNLEARLQQHRLGETPGFTSRYAVNQLLRYEEYPTAGQAIAREKQIKGWTRAKKIALIESDNPGWLDLAKDW